MLFAPGTPFSVIEKAEKEWLNKQNGQGTVPRMTPPPEPSVPSQAQRIFDRLSAKENLNTNQQRRMKAVTQQLGGNPQPTPAPLESTKLAAPPPRPPIVSPMPPRPAPTSVQGTFKKGGYVSNDGKINLGSCRVSTAVKNKNNSNW